MTAALSADDGSALAAALARAVRDAGGDPPGGTGCRFYPLPAGAAALMPPQGPGAWVLVAVEQSREPEQAAHVCERARTAAQRFTLALWAEGVAAVWLGEHLPTAAALADIGVALRGAEPLGLVWLPAAA